jgi:hypothetical protein
MKKKPMRATVPVTMRALVQRINRKLAKDDEQLRKTRGQRWWTDLGDYHIVNYNMNALMRGHVDPEALGRELGVLSEWERVAEPDAVAR